MTSYAAVSISGMILDVLGAVVLARSFVLKQPEEVFRDVRSLGTWDFPVTRGARDLLVSWLVQAAEARTGAVIIAVGFSLQALAQFTSPTPVNWGWFMLLGVLASAVTAFFVLQRRFVSTAATQARAFYDALEREATSEDWKREITLRRQELISVARDPGAWLKPRRELDPLDKTLTSEQ